MALFDAFLKLDGIKGESADSKHKGEIDVVSFSWGMQQRGSSATGGGGGTGKVQVHDITISKRTDASSPLLMLNCANGAHIKTATFVVRKAGGTQLEYLTIQLKDVLISSYLPRSSDFGFEYGGRNAGFEYGGRNAGFEYGGFEYGGRPNAAFGDGSVRPANIGSYDWASPSAWSGTGGAGRGSAVEIPYETITLNFASVQMTYQPQGADGKAQGGPIIAGWDVKANQKI